MDAKQLNKFKKDIKSIAGINAEEDWETAYINAEEVLALIKSAYERGQKDGANKFAKLAGLSYEKN